MSKIINMKIESCVECPHHRDGTWVHCDLTQKEILLGEIANHCPLNDCLSDKLKLSIETVQGVDCEPAVADSIELENKLSWWIGKPYEPSDNYSHGGIDSARHEVPLRPEDGYYPPEYPCTEEVQVVDGVIRPVPWPQDDNIKRELVTERRKNRKLERSVHRLGAIIDRMSKVNQQLTGRVSSMNRTGRDLVRDQQAKRQEIARLNDIIHRLNLEVAVLKDEMKNMVYREVPTDGPVIA